MTERLRERVRLAARSLWDARAELALTVALLLGWAALAVGLRTVLPGRGRAAVWPLAVALLCFAGCGFQFVGRLAWRGLYAPTRPTGER